MIPARDWLHYLGTMPQEKRDNECYRVACNNPETFLRLYNESVEEKKNFPEGFRSMEKSFPYARELLQMKEVRA